MIPDVANEDPIIEVSHIDFVLGDWPLKLQDYVQIVQIHDLKLPFIRAHIQSKSRHQKTPYQKTTWNKRSNQASKQCKQNEDQEEYRKGVCLISDPG